MILLSAAHAGVNAVGQRRASITWKRLQPKGASSAQEWKLLAKLFHLLQTIGNSEQAPLKHTLQYITQVLISFGSTTKFHRHCFCLALKLIFGTILLEIGTNRFYQGKTDAIVDSKKKKCGPIFRGARQMTSSLSQRGLYSDFRP